MSGFFNDCDVVNCGLETLEDLGLNLHKIGIFTRTWPEKLGKDTPQDSVEYFKPTPRLESIRLIHGNDKGGTQRKGDLRIKLLSKNQYSESDLNCISDDELKELYYFINDDLYEVVDIDERIAYFNVTVRKAKKRKLFL